MKYLFTIVVLFTLVSCSGVVYVHKNTEALPQDQKVKVLADGALDIYKINNELVDLTGEKWVHADSQIYLAPGQYTFLMRYKAGGGAYSRGYLQASGEFIAGKVYRIAYDQDGRSINVYIKEVLEQKK